MRIHHVDQTTEPLALAGDQDPIERLLWVLGEIEPELTVPQESAGLRLLFAAAYRCLGSDEAVQSLRCCFETFAISLDAQDGPNVFWRDDVVQCDMNDHQVDLCIEILESMDPLPLFLQLIETPATIPMLAVAEMVEEQEPVRFVLPMATSRAAHNDQPTDAILNEHPAKAARSYLLDD